MQNLFYSLCMEWHQTSSNNAVSTDINMQPDPVQDRLLQRRASRRTDRQYPETFHQSQNDAARIVLQESRRSHAKLLLHQLLWLPVQQQITIEVGSSCVRTKFGAGPLWFTYIPLNHRTCLQPNFTFFCNPKHS